MSALGPALERASRRVQRVVAGMPRSRRGKRALLVLIAYVDDSQEDHARKADPIFVLAGYIAPEEQWELFADEWEARLPLVRPSTSFKMSEVAARWGVHDERIMFFYRVIEQYASGAFSCIVPVRDVQAAFAKFPLRLGSPGIYSMMFSAVLDWLCNPRAQADLGISGKIRFIFDTQMFEDTKIMERWDRLLHYMPESTRHYWPTCPSSKLRKTSCRFKRPISTRGGQENTGRTTPSTG